ncbi:hypothetical protein GJ744_007555 [Endocarpon pusillum]|uniref:Uncharacterized protein n=1 Tax=Endocarpon pusillum TaxID=364733 RepID=A0A8H7AK99_9EURO|nr:hypothetical protein GJ744_007555 [Endocarpon pusillum]
MLFSKYVVLLIGTLGTSAFPVSYSGLDEVSHRIGGFVKRWSCSFTYGWCTIGLTYEAAKSGSGLESTSTQTNDTNPDTINITIRPQATNSLEGITVEVDVNGTTSAV